MKIKLGFISIEILGKGIIERLQTEAEKDTVERQLLFSSIPEDYKSTVKRLLEITTQRGMLQGAENVLREIDLDLLSLAQRRKEYIDQQKSEINYLSHQIVHLKGLLGNQNSEVALSSARDFISRTRPTRRRPSSRSKFRNLP